MKNIFKILTVFVSVLFVKQNIFAQAGTLDPTFGDGGIAIVDNIFSTGNYSILQIDEKVIVASADTGISLYRFNPDGTFDLSFGNNGHFYFNSKGKIYGSENKVIAIQENNKIICAGRYFPTGIFGKNNLALIRINSNGTIDSSYGLNGLDTLELDKITKASGLVVQPDGKIVVSGDV